MNNPITNCDIFYNGFLKTINIFTNKNKQYQHEFNTEIIEFNSMIQQQHQQQKISNIYIGKYNSQIYAQNIKYEDEEEELFKKRFLFENNKEMLQHKTKSTMNNNLVISNKFTNNQQQNQIALINNKKNYDIFFQEAVLVGENNELRHHNDDDDDDDDDGKNYHLLINEHQFIADFDYLINNYINMILLYKKIFNHLLHVSSIIFIIFLSFKRFVLR